MQIDSGTVISLISLVICVSTFFINNKKSNKTDGFELGSFMGEMRTELTNIKTLIEELKHDHKEVDKKIHEAIINHEAIYHGKGE